MLKSNPTSSVFYLPFRRTGIWKCWSRSQIKLLQAPPHWVVVLTTILYQLRPFYYLLLDIQVSLETQAPENSIGAITLPSSLMNNLPANEVELASRIQFNFFETPALFQVKLLLTGFGWFGLKMGDLILFNHHILLTCYKSNEVLKLWLILIHTLMFLMMITSSSQQIYSTYK